MASMQSYIIVSLEQYLNKLALNDRDNLLFGLVHLKKILIV